MKIALLIAALFWSDLGFGQAQIVSSFTVLDYWAGKLTPVQFSHKSLIPSGGELHGFQLSPADIHTLNQAKLVVGLNPLTEPWLLDWAKSNNRQSDIIWLNPDSSKLHLHAWLNPDSAKSMVILLSTKLKGHLKIPEKESQVLLNEELKEIDEAASVINGLFAPIPENRRKIIAYHPSLESFADYFNITVVTTIVDSAVAESADPSIKRYSEILKIIKKEEVRLITYDEGQSNRIATQLARDSKLPSPVSLSFEYLQPAGKEGDTWPTMMIMNARKIADGLQK